MQDVLLGLIKATVKIDDRSYWQHRLFSSLENVDHLLQEKMAFMQSNVENSFQRH